jgi:hypothetical protein
MAAQKRTTKPEKRTTKSYSNRRTKAEPVTSPLPLTALPRLTLQTGNTPVERWYRAQGPIGARSNSVTVSGNLGNATLLIYPFWGCNGLTIDKIGFRNTNTAAGAKAIIGLYTRKSDTDLTPTAVIDQSGEILMSADTNAKTYTLTNAYLVPDDGVLLAAITWNASASSVAAVFNPTVADILGDANTFPVTASGATWAASGYSNPLVNNPTGLSVAPAMQVPCVFIHFQ